jgi:hypothetical protein
MPAAEAATKRIAPSVKANPMKRSRYRIVFRFPTASHGETARQQGRVIPLSLTQRQYARLRCNPYTTFPSLRHAFDRIVAQDPVSAQRNPFCAPPASLRAK